MKSSLIAHAHARASPLLHNPKWSRSFIPTLADLSSITSHVPAEIREQVLTPPRPLTQFEIADGKPMAFDTSKSSPANSTLEAMAALFREEIAPATQALNTRTGYWGGWRAFVTFMFLQGAIAQCFPASKIALEAFCLQLVMVGYAAGTIEHYIESILDRHRQFQVLPSVNIYLIRSWVEAMKRGLGVPSKPKFQILSSHIRCILQLPRTTLTLTRDIAIMAIGTMCALRVSEILRIDVCDLLWDHDGPDTLAICIWKRKNDQGKRGLYPRIAAAVNRALCVIALLRAYCAANNLVVSPHCTKTKYSRSPCDACGRLFRKTATAPKNSPHAGSIQLQATTIPKHGVTRDIVCKAVRKTLSLIGIEPGKASGISMRRGGISTALAAGVDKDIRKLQSGHRSDSGHASYADILDIDQLYLFSRSFGF